jgi:hypothetical protein
MHEYDTVLNSLLQDPRNGILELITGVKIGRWLNVEMPEVTQPRVDLLGETVGDRSLVGVELQSYNDALLPLRMAEYSLHVYRLHRRFPKQYVLYVGNAAMNMASELVGPNFYCRYEIIDIRDVSEDWLLRSPFDADNILAILANHRDHRETIRRILERIATLEGAARKSALKKVRILAGLRKFGDTMLTEVKRMPIVVDSTMDPPGRVSRILAEEGERIVIRRLIAKRFGEVPAWVEERLTGLSGPELEEVSLRLLDITNIDGLFNPDPPVQS